MGFGATKPIGEQDYDVMKDKILEEAKKAFKPEFINRLDDIIVFHTLGKPELLQIVDLEISEGARRASRPRRSHIDLDDKREGIAHRERLRPAIRRASDAPRGRALPRGSDRRRDPARQRQARRRGPSHGQPTGSSPSTSRSRKARRRARASSTRSRTAGQADESCCTRFAVIDAVSCLTPAGARRRRPASGVRPSRACRSALSKDWRGRATPARCADRRRHRAGGWRSCAAACAG